MILYIDPSVMTYAIQAIVGIVIAIGAFVGIYYRKAKKKINNKLGRDENKNKEVETDEIIVKDEASKEIEEVKEEKTGPLKEAAERVAKEAPKSSTKKKTTKTNTKTNTKTSSVKKKK